MEWTDLDREAERWKVPAKKMKMRQPHIVPLASQSVEVLRQIHLFSGSGDYVFSSARKGGRSLSDNGVPTALRSLGYTNEQLTPLGFRATARTLLDEELKCRVDYIRHQLAHAVKDPLRSA